MKGVRRRLLGIGAAALAGRVLPGCASAPDAEPAPASGTGRRLFDCHCHIIDPRFPLVVNQGYLPPAYTLDDYRAQTLSLGVRSGVVVSGSFHGFDQACLRDALARLGPEWAGVAQVPGDIADAEIASLAAAGVRGLRFNLYRGRIDGVDDIVALANRVHGVARWHAEIYADAAALRPHVARLAKLPHLVVDHLGMSAAGLPALLDLVDAGARVKATGFGRVEMDVPAALEAIAGRDPAALMFGTDLPSTRARRPFTVADIDLIERVLGADLAPRALWSNARATYRLPASRG
jgi:predicted TIM-barrel fold metal-dependent hydrolase